MLSSKFFYSLLKAHEEEHNYATDTLDHFNFFLERRLERMIKEHCQVNVTIPGSATGFSETKRHVVTFEKMAIERPTVPHTDGIARGIRVMQVDGEPLFPHEALIRGLTYSAGIFVDIKYDIYTGEGDDEKLEDSTLYKNVYFFNMPIAVKSKACLLQDPELAADGNAHMDPEDKGGYWIVRGMVKVIQPQKVQRNNILLVRNIVKGTERWLEANIRSIRADDKFRSTSTLRCYLLSNGMLTIDIPYLKSNQTIVAAFRLLGFEDRDKIEEFIFDEGSLPFGVRQDHMDAARRLFATTFASALASCSTDELITAMGSVLTHDGDFGKLKRMVNQQVCGELLPHCGFDDSVETRTKKAIYLGMICRRMLYIQLGFEEEDDRDFEGFKSLQMCSTTLSMLMRQLFGQFSKTLRKRIFDRVKTGNAVDIASVMHHMDCIPQLATAFTDGEVTVQKEASNAGKEVIQLVQQVNPLSLQSHIARINTPLPKSGKYPQCRNIDTSQLFSICPTKTPEGEGAGLLQNLTIASKVRVSTDMDDVERLLMSFPSVTSLDDTHRCLVFLNSDPIARTTKPLVLLEAVREARRTQRLPQTLTVVLAPYGLLITTDIGVVTFPLLVLKNMHKLQAAIDESEFGGTNLWTTMVHYGIIEYVDPWESMDYVCAFKYEDALLKDAHGNPTDKLDPEFTHLAPHPTSFFSTAAGTVPFANHNQAPRNVYQCLDPREPVLVQGKGHLKIQHVKVGDSILAYDFKSGTHAWARVLNHYVNPVDRECVQVWTASGKWIRCTWDHPIWTRTRGWVRAKELSTERKAGPFGVDELLVLDITTPSLIRHYERVEYVASEPDMEMLCDVTLDHNDHAFFAGGNNKGMILVHNSGMAEQAISAPSLNVFDRHEMNYRHLLWYPQKPVCTTHIAEVKGLNTWPMGSNAILAIAPYFTSEDSITFCSASEEFGMMRITVMRSHRAVAKKRGTDIELFEHPMNPHSSVKCVGLRGECDYSKLGADGLPLPGTWLKNNDIIIGRTGKVHEVGPDGELREVKRDRSVVLHCDPSEHQVVDKVIITENKDGNRLVRVTTRSTRRLQCGDKLSSRHGQKGTVGTMLRPEDMPFVASGPNQGMRPDIIINLQCINGRMTIGKLLEMLYGSVGVVQGAVQDATPFFHVSAKWALEQLLKEGYSDTYTMISGTTGEVYDKPWFLGVCFYQRLKHHVLDKVAARARGVRAVLTRQPVDGRANNGGQKFGEMEFDAMKANGAAHALYDRSVIASDLFKTMICKACGTMGEISTPTLGGLVDGEGYLCRACKVKNQSVSMDTTYCYSGLLVKELAAMGIGVTHHIGGTEVQHPKKRIPTMFDDLMEE